jgi:hypothetical protein
MGLGGGAAIDGQVLHGAHARGSGDACYRLVRISDENSQGAIAILMRACNLWWRMPDECDDERHLHRGWDAR